MPTLWEPSKQMALLPAKVYVQIEGRDVAVQAWLYIVKSLTGGSIPVFSLILILQRTLRMTGRLPPTSTEATMYTGSNRKSSSA